MKRILTIGDDEKCRLRNLALIVEGEESTPIGDATVSWQLLLREDDTVVASGSMSVYDAVLGHYVGDIPSVDTVLLENREEYRLVAIVVTGGKTHTIDLEVIAKKGAA